MANTSATGGVLTGTETSIEGQTLDRLLNQFIANVTGLSGSLVRPSWQPNPPKMPDASVNWCAFGIIIIDADQYAYFQQNTNDTTLIRHEKGELSMTFYGGDAFLNAKKMRDGIQLQQNRDLLRSYGVTPTATQPLNHVPELINDIWYNRVDMLVEFAREINSTYNVLPLISCGTKTIKTETITVQS